MSYNLYLKIIFKIVNKEYKYIMLLIEISKLMINSQKIENYDVDNDEGHFLEVSGQYLEELRGLTIIYPF